MPPFPGAPNWEQGVMTTVENERDRVTTVRETSVAEPPTGPMTAVPVAVRERFGGAKVGAAFFGWLVAIGMTVLLTGLVALAVAAWGRGEGAVPFLGDTASVGLASFVGELSTPVHTVMAIGILYTLPAVVFYLFVQRYVVAGMTAGSVKG